MPLVNLVIGAVVLAVGVLIGQLLRIFGITWFRPTPICDDPGPPGCGSNPRPCGTSQAIVFGPGGDLAEYPDCGERPATVVVAHEGSRGLESSMRAQLMFSPSPEVEVTVMHFGNPGRVEAFDTTGSLVDMVVMGPTANVEQRFILRAAAITRVDVTAGSPTDPVLIIGWCH
jgi:hypothetical protein